MFLCVCRLKSVVCESGAGAVGGVCVDTMGIVLLRDACGAEGGSRQRKRLAPNHPFIEADGKCMHPARIGRAACSPRTPINQSINQSKSAPHYKTHTCLAVAGSFLLQPRRFFGCSAIQKAPRSAFFWSESSSAGKPHPAAAHSIQQAKPRSPWLPTDPDSRRMHRILLDALSERSIDQLWLSHHRGLHPECCVLPPWHGRKQAKISEGSAALT